MRTLWAVVFAGAALVCAVAALGQEQKLNAEAVVAKHLESIGTAQARAAIKSRTAQANARMDMVIGAAGHSEGMAMLVSLGRQLSIQMKFPDGQYPNEQ